uniref:hypothetical protein 47 n=1 Tax=Moniliophthora perniciosa TaxID=153609 RepID=UPI000024235B|nr:hypothetical protein 47 [Moniliophthora perniciosa]AAQ74342.1 hypothetical protein 47 [Moniliophthora perniciosa]
MRSKQPKEAKQWKESKHCFFRISSFLLYLLPCLFFFFSLLLSYPHLPLPLLRREGKEEGAGSSRVRSKREGRLRAGSISSRRS